MEKTAITAAHLVVKKSNQRILQSLEFNVGKGTITGLIGPSGSGKTTLMRAIVGVQKYKGDLTVLGKPAGHKDLRKKIGYLPQSKAVYPDLTVVQNLKYFAKLVNADKDNIDEAIKAVHLEKQRNQVVSSLSGGQEARVSLAVALLGDPELLVLDEPTVGLDPVLRNDLWKLFAGLAKKGKTLLISSHVMDEAARCENLMLLREGKLLWRNSQKKLLQVTRKKTVDDAFVAAISAAERSEKAKAGGKTK